MVQEDEFSSYMIICMLSSITGQLNDWEKPWLTDTNIDTIGQYRIPDFNTIIQQNDFTKSKQVKMIVVSHVVIVSWSTWELGNGMSSVLIWYIRRPTRNLLISSLNIFSFGEQRINVCSLMNTRNYSSNTFMHYVLEIITSIVSVIGLSPLRGEGITWTNAYL